MRSKLVGRERECQELHRVMESDRSEFVIVYGRRRVGKTFLVDQYYQGQYDFTFVGGHNLSRQRQLTSFSRALKKFSGTKPDKFSDWFDAFDALEEYLESLDANRKKVVFIDEMPWIDTQKSDFVAALENFWNGWAARRSDIVFIASGSATSWMVDNLIENQGGLHARITSSIYVRPFTLHETEAYLLRKHCKWDRYQILQCYMVFGGIPFYLSLINAKESLVQNVDRLFFAQGGIMRSEFDELYNALFSNADLYISVVKGLAAHHDGMSREEISKATGITGGTLTRVLTNLERCDFISRNQNFAHKVKDTIIVWWISILCFIISSSCPMFRATNNGGVIILSRVKSPRGRGLHLRSYVLCTRTASSVPWVFRGWRLKSHHGARQQLMGKMVDRSIWSSNVLTASSICAR